MPKNKPFVMPTKDTPITAEAVRDVTAYLAGILARMKDLNRLLEKNTKPTEETK